MNTSPDFIKLREKITRRSKDFTPEERDLLLDCMNLGDYTGKHEYQPDHGPGSDLWASGAWALLDKIAPGKLSRPDRFMLAGMIAGALRQMFETGRRSRG